MREVLLTFILTQYILVVHGYEDLPRFFTNGHGGYQFFYANDEHQQSINNRRMDSDANFSDNILHFVKAPSANSISHKDQVPEVIVNVTSNNAKVSLVPVKSVEDSSAENRILKDSPTPRIYFTTPSTTRRRQVSRRRIVVRKFKPKTAEKNKKREISSEAAPGNHLLGTRIRSKIAEKYKFTNRNFKPMRTDKPKNKHNGNNNNRSALFTRKPSDKFMQLHFRKLDVITSTTTPSSMHQGMKEKRHLANIRFFSRRKLKS